MRRGEVWWADLDPPAGSRPVLLVSRDEAYLIRDFVTAAPITRRARHIPTEVPLGAEEGLAQASVVNLDSLTTVPKEQLRYRAGALGPEKVRAMEVAIHFALGLEG